MNYSENIFSRKSFYRRSDSMHRSVLSFLKHIDVNASLLNSFVIDTVEKFWSLNKTDVNSPLEELKE